jgi:hypothetical protein
MEDAQRMAGIHVNASKTCVDVQGETTTVPIKVVFALNELDTDNFR